VPSIRDGGEHLRGITFN